MQNITKVHFFPVQWKNASHRIQNINNLVSAYEETASIHPSSIHPFVRPPICQSVHCLSMHAFTYPSICPSTHASIQPSDIQTSIHSFIHLFIYPSSLIFIHLSICPFIHPPSHLSIHPPMNSLIHLCLHSLIHLCNYYSFIGSSLMFTDKGPKFESANSSMLRTYSLPSGLIILKENTTRS